MVSHATFNRTVRQALKKKSWSMRRVAREAGLDSSFLSKVLNGKRNPPLDERVIIKLARKLDIEPDTLVIYAGRIPTKYQKDLEKPGILRLLSETRFPAEGRSLLAREGRIKKVAKEEMPDELL